MTAKQNLGDFAKLLAKPHTSGRQFDLVHAGHRATVNTDEMRVRRVMVIVFGDQFESPNSIAEFGSPQQAGGGHIVKVAKYGCFIDTQIL